tara:strand:- start:3143 stop:3373 length:231 start_codon:yes stop_codon:yes gene_type:complete
MPHRIPMCFSAQEVKTRIYYNNNVNLQTNKKLPPKEPKQPKIQPMINRPKVSDLYSPVDLRNMFKPKQVKGCGCGG